MVGSSESAPTMALLKPVPVRPPPAGSQSSPNSQEQSGGSPHLGPPGGQAEGLCTGLAKGPAQIEGLEAPPGEVRGKDKAEKPSLHFNGPLGPWLVRDHMALWHGSDRCCIQHSAVGKLRQGIEPSPVLGARGRKSRRGEAD